MPKKERINRLRVVLSEKELMHKDFAKMVDMTPNSITRICNNIQQPSLKVLRQMARALGVDVCKLIEPV